LVETADPERRADEPAKVSLGWYGQMIAHTDEEREVAPIDEEDELVAPQ